MTLLYENENNTAKFFWSLKYERNQQFHHKRLTNTATDRQTLTCL